MNFITSYLLDKISYLVTFFGTLLAVIVALRDYHKRKIEEVKEKSVGAEALRVLRIEIDVLKEQTKHMHENDEHLKKVISRLEEDYNSLMNRFFEFFKPRSFTESKRSTVSIVSAASKEDEQEIPTND